MAQVITVLLKQTSLPKHTTYQQKENEMKAIVWSKDQCAFCEQAKGLLEMKGIEYEVRNISQDWTREQLLESVPTARSVPQIFLDDEYVGGFQELRQRLM
jgi:glutaredoxin